MPRDRLDGASTPHHAPLAAASAMLLIALLMLGGRGMAADDAEQAMLVGSPGYPNRDLFAVEFFAVDGKNISPRDVLWLDPGTHVITVRVPERFTESIINQRRQKWTDYVDIELELEAGKIYDIRGRYNRSDRDNPYDLVVDRVRDGVDG